MGSLYATYAELVDYLHDAAEMDECAADLFAMMKSGVVKVPIDKRHRPADAAQAHADLEGKRTSGGIGPSRTMSFSGKLTTSVGRKPISATT